MTVDSRFVGSSFDEFLEEEGIVDDVEALAMKRSITYAIEDAMRQLEMTPTALAKAMGTSRAAVNRLLDANQTALTLKTVASAFRVLGLRLSVGLAPVKSARKSSRKKSAEPALAADAPAKPRRRRSAA